MGRRCVSGVRRGRWPRRRVRAGGSWRSAARGGRRRTGVDRKASTMAAAASGGQLPAGEREDVEVVVLAGQRRAGRVAECGAARIPGTLLAAMAMPTPLPHTRMPRSASPPATRARDRRRVVGVVDRAAGGGAEVAPGDAARVERLLERFLQREARVVGAERDDHAANCTLAIHADRLRSLLAARRACATGIRGSTARTSSTPRPHGGEVVRVRRPAPAPARPRVLLRPVADRPADGDPRRPRRRRGVLARRGSSAAIAFRERLGIDASAWRLVHGEGDLLPSLIVDRYADVLVVQTLSQGTERLLPAVRASADGADRRRRRARAQRPAGAGARGPRPAGVGVARRRARSGPGARGAGRVRDRPAARAEDRAVPRPAREPRRRRRLRARPAARRLQLPRRVRAGDGRGVLARRGARRLGAGGGADPGQRRPQPPAARRGPRGQCLRRAAPAREGRGPLRHRGARPAGVRQEQGGAGEGGAPATRRSTCGRCASSSPAASW